VSLCDFNGRHPCPGHREQQRIRRLSARLVLDEGQDEFLQPLESFLGLVRHPQRLSRSCAPRSLHALRLVQPRASQSRTHSKVMQVFVQPGCPRYWQCPQGNTCPPIVALFLTRRRLLKCVDHDAIGEDGRISELLDDHGILHHTLQTRLDALEI